MNLEVGHVRTSPQAPGVVRAKIGALFVDMDPPTARAYAIALISEAEKAGLPPLPPEGRRKVA